MAGEDNLLTRLAAQMAGLDDAAWCALASRGLLRRARKDLAGGVAPELIETEAARVRIRVGEREVILDASGISGGSCDCPAAGCCQHLLAACLALPELAGPMETAPAESGEDSPDEWLEMDEAEIRKWCGAADFRRALDLALNQVDSVLGGRVVFRSGIDCHLVAGAGLEGVITSAQPRHARMYAVAGVLAYREAHGQPASREEVRAGGFAEELPAGVAAWLEDCVELGLQYLTAHAVAVARTLSMSCRTGGLYRPALELERIAQLIEWQLERHAKADSEKLFVAMARLRALMVALGKLGMRAPDDLRGRARTKYDERRRLELVGMGAYPWESESGFQGITILFWAPGEERFVSLGDARPRGVGFDPVGRFGGGAPWRGIGSLKDLARSRFFLSRPKLNEWGRLSSSESTVVESPEACVWPEHGPAVVRNWKELAAGVDPLPGLRRSGPLDRLVVVEPAKWGKAEFDEVEQRLNLAVEDEDGETLPVSLAFSPLSEGAIRLLEDFDFSRDRPRLLASYETRGGRWLSPLAVFVQDRRWDVFLETVPKEKASRFSLRKIGAKARAWFGPGEEDDEDGERTDEWGAYLLPLARDLRQRAESGLHRVVDVAATARWRKELDRAGLGEFGRAVGKADTAAGLLEAKYLHTLLGGMGGE